jgi:LPS export ABC transporter protein LptC
MRTSQAARYARWAATAAILLTVTVVAVYFYRGWQASRARQDTPPVVPAPVKQRSLEFSFSKVEGDRTLFTIRASQSTLYKAGEEYELKDVRITIYGRGGKRFDNIYTASCKYQPQTGRITCAGDVQIDLESAEEAKRQPGARVIQLRTSNISFDRETGLARTEQPVEFRFPYGQGRGVGVTYSTREARVELHRDVELTLNPPDGRLVHAGSRRAAAQSEPILLTGASLEYQRDERILRLLGPVRVRQGNRELTAGKLALEFDATLRARRAVVNGNPQLRALEPGGDLTINAEELVASFHSGGWVERVLAEGQVRGLWKEAGQEDRFEAQRVELALEPHTNAPQVLNASGSVRASSREPRGNASRRLETEALQFTFAAASPGRPRRVQRVETKAPATVEWADAEENTRVRSQRLSAEFDARHRIQRLTGSSGVEIERAFGQKTPQVSRSEELAVTFAPGGDWTQMEQRGSVRFREGERTVEAQRASVTRATDIVTLTGAATVADSLTRTSAQTILLNQRTGEVRAEGGVRTTYRSVETNGAANLAAEPAHISADQLRAGRDTGRALYTGRARFWQGEAVIEAGAIELFRQERKFEARGSVRGLFPQRGDPAPGAVSSEPLVWRVQAGALTYFGGERRAHLEENVSAQSRTGQIAARAMDLFFEVAPGRTQELARVEAGGSVMVRQGQRRGTADSADYIVAEGKFTLFGGTPTLFDAARGTTTGRQLTFFLADDKILIDSEEGSRTLTRHRVEK